MILFVCWFIFEYSHLISGVPSDNYILKTKIIYMVLYINNFLMKTILLPFRASLQINGNHFSIIRIIGNLA